MSTEKDLMDFINEAPAENPQAVLDLLDHLNNGISEGDLCQLFHDWGYNGVRIKDCATLVSAGRDDSVWRAEIRERDRRAY